ncbi:response regulator transcription factor [bacterium]|nr:MAG: response regulator transcription factor [bacterium]
MRVLLAAPDPGPFLPLIQALSDEGLDAWALGDLVGLMDPVDPSRVLGGPPNLFFLAGAPAAVLQAAVEGIRKCPQLRAKLVFVYQPEADLNERSRIMNAGADDCQARVLPEALIVARIRALLRRAPPPEVLAAAADATTLAWGKLSLDLVRRRAATPFGELEPTRLQFDALAALVRAREAGLPAAELQGELIRRGHNADARGAAAALDALSAELAGHGYEVERRGGQVRLAEAGPDRKLAALARRFLDALAVVASNARLYGEGAGAVMQYARLAHESLLAYTSATRAADLRVARAGEDALVNGVPPSGGALPPPVAELMKAVGAETLVFAAWAAPEDLARFCAGAWAPGPAAPSGAVMVARAGSYDLAASRSLMRRFVAALPGDPGDCAELFGEAGELVHKTRAKAVTYRGASAVRAFLARLPRPVTAELLREREEGEEHVAEVAVSAGGLPAVIEEYRLTARDGALVRLEARSRLRI